MAQSHTATLRPVANSSEVGKRPKIWVDLDNTPHVPFFEPIIEELSARGFEVVLTARDAFQVCELADRKGLHYARVGRHHGRNRALKLVGLFYRAGQLAPFVLHEKPDLALSHGARSQMIVANLFRIPTVLIDDYEHSQYPFLMRPKWEIIPEVIPDASVGCAPERIRKYPGIKEDVYVGRMKPDPDFRVKMGIASDALLVTVRPPADEAHYHNPEAEELFVRVMEMACRQKGSRIVLLPRHGRQGESIQARWPGWFENARTLIPRAAVDGLNLLWHSDLIIGGGGTMNREAAALGVPVYSVFRGKIGAVDAYLQKTGRLVLLESALDVERKIRWSQRNRPAVEPVPVRPALNVLVGHIEKIARLQVV